MNNQRKFFFIDGFLIKASWRSPSGSEFETMESEMDFYDVGSEWDAIESPEDDNGAVFQIEVEQVVPGTVLFLRS